nr:aldo/keto reductase [Nakamurella alba]
MELPALELNTGRLIPQIGFGTARLPDEEVRVLVRDALALGYTAIDTAASYDNEIGVGQGLADSGLRREDLYVTTKLRGADQGSASVKHALRQSLDRLGLEYVDLYLIHWPLPRLDRYVESWIAMTELVDEGLVRDIGVSNFTPEYLDRLAAESDTVPAVNQIELHPKFPQQAQREDDSERGIVTESWSPLGQDGSLFTDPTVLSIADRYRKTAAQVLIRWHLDQGLVVIPKASSPARIAQNLDVLDFALDEQDLAAMARLDTGQRVNGQHPAEYEEF